MPGKVIGLDRGTAKIRAIGLVLQRPLTTILASEARVTAISLAKSTIPYGTGDSALQSGRNAVARDIHKAYLQPRLLYRDILLGGGGNSAGRLAIHNQFDSLLRVKTKYDATDYAKLFWQLYKAGQFDKAEAILKQFGKNFQGAKFGPFDGGAAHRAARDPITGRVKLKLATLALTDDRGLDAYIAEVQEHVGTAKGAWSDVGRQLGSIRGLKAAGDIGATWITHHRGAGRVEWIDLNGTSPQVKMTNTISYSDRLLSPSERDRAIRIAHERLLKSLRIAVQAETRNLRRAA